MLILRAAENQPQSQKSLIYTVYPSSFEIFRSISFLTKSNSTTLSSLIRARIAETIFSFSIKLLVCLEL